MATLGDELSMIAQRAQSLHEHQDTQTQIISDLYAIAQRFQHNLYTETHSLKKALQDAELDLADARKSRRDFQAEAQQLKNQLQALDASNKDMQSHPYVAVLIDGDGCLFQNHYITDGYDGGKMAAYAMRAAIMEKLPGITSKTDIIVKICANQAGLATALRQSNNIVNEQTFKQFCIGFTQSKASFDYVDVGPGKERADAKIRETARWHLNNVNCKNVLLGISHDSGYAPFLDELHSSTDDRGRLSILEGFPTVRELMAFNLPIVNLNDTVFRHDKIVVDRSASTYTNGNGQTITKSPTAPLPAAEPLGYVSRDPPGPKPSEIAKGKSGKGTSPGNSYAATATVARTNGPPTVDLPASTKKLQQTKAAALATAVAKQKEKIKPTWSPGPRGLDEPVTYTAPSVDAVKRRKGPDKFCNTFILCGYCTKDICEYNHKLKATPEEKKALAFLMRQSPCTYGQDCANDDCIYGHNCPSVHNGNCLQPYCRFPSKLHPPQTKFKQPFLGDTL